MSDDRGMTRREWLRGRFLRDHKKSTGPLDRATELPAGHAAGLPVMRYPQAASDLNGTSPNQTRADSPQARRRVIPLFRPPGAISETQFLTSCTRCEECITACPHDAIVKAPAQFREAADTPMIDPDRQPCLLCHDFPCIEACEPLALDRALPVSLGTARITEQTCLAYQGTVCSVCSERCPVDGAITQVDGKPRVDESLCVGCGICRFVCPAPENAILLMPQFTRPVAPEGRS